MSAKPTVGISRLPPHQALRITLSPSSRKLSRRILAGTSSEVASAGLIALHGLEEGLEIALTEAAGAATLDDLEEDGRAVGDGFGEDLQQGASFVAVDQNAEALKIGPRQFVISDATAGLVVVGIGHLHETQPARPERV